MTTLAIDTSTPQGSVAILTDRKLIFSELIQAGRSHSSQLFACLERALVIAPSIDQIAVGLGPGSYAGVRIAISAAIGFGIATGAKLLGLASIVALDEGDYISLGDARRGSFYFAEVRGGECLVGPMLLSAEELCEKLAESSGLPVYASEILPDFPQVEIRYPSAERLARFAEIGRSVYSREDLEPIYLRDPHITQPKPR
ncbi:MAG: tRNA (adenosine(37)-N6)-threonylcarbamoyltransferase complex dimerization subunit type 1 TsaB [Verrucomicrobiota bacterium]